MGVEPPEGSRRGRTDRIRLRCTRENVVLTHGRGGGYRSGDTGELGARIALPRSGRETNDEGRTTVPFSVGFRAADLSYIEHEDKLVAEMTVHIRAETLDGEVLAQVFHDLHHAVPKGAAAPSGILTLKGTVDAPQGDYRLVAFLRSMESSLRATSVRELSLP